MQRLWNQAIKDARDLLGRITPEVIPHVSLDQLSEPLRTLRRQLNALDSKANTAAKDGNIQELQAEASNLGRRILNIAQFGVERLAPDLKAALLHSGHQLHVLETEQLFLDGGESTRQIAQNLKQGIAEFKAAVDSVLPRD
jgi:uncharacterized phage infection (PIP) family protein YhgE